MKICSDICPWTLSVSQSLLSENCSLLGTVNFRRHISSHNLFSCKMEAIVYVFFTIYGYIMNSECDQPPDGLIGQLVVHCTSIVEVIGSNPDQALILQMLISCVYYCDDLSCLHLFLRSSNI